MQPVIRSVVQVIKRESPTILTGLGITGFITTIFMAVRATPKALDLLEEERELRYKEGIKTDPISKIDTIKITWKCYLPSALVGLGTISCFIGANSISLRRNAALASLFSVTEAALKDYQEKVIEIVGKNKAEKIHEAVVQKKLDAHPYSDKEVYLTGKGETLFYDEWSGRYFKSDQETIRRIQNNINADLVNGPGIFVSLNELYQELGLDPVRSGEEMGWNIGNAQLDIGFTARLVGEDLPCIVIQYDVYPEGLDLAEKT